MKRKLLYGFLVLVVLLGAAAYFFTLTPQEVEAELRRTEEMNSDREAADWQDYIRFVGFYNWRPVVRTYVCFGDVCPQNGGYFLRYLWNIDSDRCKEMGGEPVWGIGWTEVYGGCEVRP